MKIEFKISKKQKDGNAGFIIKYDDRELFRSGVVVLINYGNISNVIAKTFKNVSDLDDYTIHYSKSIECITLKEYRIVFRLLANIKSIETKR
jgi:hypothetical protein